EKVVVPHLVKILLSSDSSEAVAAAISLGKMGWRAKEAIPQLIQALSDSDRLVREYAAAALGEIGEDVYIINEKN
ncbi:MAG TPA: HEAT repeat domain-containing protein, partial [Bdellovibrionota bacterium]|nr:HEAT repeat domain-containing protein [Bdellovibrionota bacterium]